MPPNAFSGVWAKLDWAKRHLSRLNDLDMQVRNANPDLVAYRDDAAARQRHYFVKYEPIIPVEYPLIAGDVLQSLRSALDHTAFALCAAGAGGRAAADNAIRKIQFPISNGGLTEYRALVARTTLIRLAKPGLEQALDALEPYRGGTGELLACLSALNNADKHRLLVTVALQVPAIDIGNMMLEMMRKFVGDTMPVAPPGSLTAFFNPADKSALKAGDTIYSEPLDGDHFNVTFAFPIALNEPSIMPIEKLFDILTRMLDRVAAVVPLFDALV